MSPTTAGGGVHDIRFPASEQPDGSESMIPDAAHPAVAPPRPYPVGCPADGGMHGLRLRRVSG